MIFRIIDLPCAVDFSKARATFSTGSLEVVMPKADPAKSLRVETKPELSSARGKSGVPATGEIDALNASPAPGEVKKTIVKARAVSSIE